MTTRYGATRDELAALARRDGASRATAPRQLLRRALRRSGAPLEDAHDAPEGAARPARRRAPARARRRSRCRRATDGATTQVALARGRRRADRDRADAQPRPRDGVRLVAGRLRDGLHVLRDRPGRLRTPPRLRARSSSRSCARSTRTAARVSNVVFMGMGEPLANVDPVLRRRSSGSTTTSASRPATSPCRPSASCPACDASPSYPLPVTLAVSLHAPDDALREHARPAEPPLPDRRRCSTRRASTRRARAAGSRSSTRASRA